MYRLINDIMLINYIVNDQVLDIIKFVFAFKGGGGGGVHHWNFGKHDFERMVDPKGLPSEPTFGLGL